MSNSEQKELEMRLYLSENGWDEVSNGQFTKQSGFIDTKSGSLSLDGACRLQNILNNFNKETCERENERQKFIDGFNKN